MIRPLSKAFALLVLTCSLVVTAVAQRKALDRFPPDAEAITLSLPGDVDPFEAIELPGEGRVRAVACGQADIWLVRDELLVMTAVDRKVRRRLPVPDGLIGLTADDRHVLRAREERNRRHGSECGSRGAARRTAESQQAEPGDRIGDPLTQSVVGAF